MCGKPDVCPSGRSSKPCKRASLTWSLRTSPPPASAPGPGWVSPGWSLYQPFLGVTASWCPRVLAWLVFKAKCFRCSSVGSKYKKSGSSVWASNPSLLEEKFRLSSSLPSWVVRKWSRFYDNLVSQPLIPASMWAFSSLPHVWESLGQFFREVCSVCNCRCGVFMKEDNFRILQCCHLEPLLNYFYFYFYLLKYS